MTTNARTSPHHDTILQKLRSMKQNLDDMREGLSNLISSEAIYVWPVDEFDPNLHIPPPPPPFSWACSMAWHFPYPHVIRAQELGLAVDDIMGRIAILEKIVSGAPE